MRTTRRLGGVLAGLLTAGGTAAAQVPAVPPLPAVPAPATAATTTTAAAPAAAAPMNLWSFLCKTPAQKAAKKKAFCESKFGQFVNGMLLPAGALTGGIIGPCCPGPNAANPDDLAKSAASPQGAAARIKAEEAQAKAKIAAIEYLAGVDCRYYPEAEAALINGLRAEKNECVRLAAAKAFASGCCCTPNVVKALTTCVSCTNKDKFPAEASELVRAYAYVALERCMAKCVEGAADENPPELPAEVKQAVYEKLRRSLPAGADLDVSFEILLSTYYKPSAADVPVRALHAEARRVLAAGIDLSPGTVAKLSGQPRSLYAMAYPPGHVIEAKAEPPKPEPVPAADPDPTAAADLPPPAPAAGPVTGRRNLFNIIQDARR